MAKEVGDLRWSVEQRLEFIEFRLFWQGQVNRSDLIETFQVSINQASGDLTKYSDLAPGNMVYNVRVRSLSYPGCGSWGIWEPLPALPFMAGSGGGWIVSSWVFEDRFVV